MKPAPTHQTPYHHTVRIWIAFSLRRRLLWIPAFVWLFIALGLFCTGRAQVGVRDRFYPVGGMMLGPQLVRRGPAGFEAIARGDPVPAEGVWQVVCTLTRFSKGHHPAGLSWRVESMTSTLRATPLNGAPPLSTAELSLVASVFAAEEERRHPNSEFVPAIRAGQGVTTAHTLVYWPECLNAGSVWLGTAMLFAALARATITTARERADRRASHDLCAHCSYNLTGNTTGTCPECGASFTPSTTA